MRIPFFRYKPRDVASIARRATYIGSHEVAGPRLRQDRTYADALAARDRIRARRSGSEPS